MSGYKRGSMSINKGVIILRDEYGRVLGYLEPCRHYIKNECFGEHPWFVLNGEDTVQEYSYCQYKLEGDSYYIINNTWVPNEHDLLPDRISYCGTIKEPIPNGVTFVLNDKDSGRANVFTGTGCLNILSTLIVSDKELNDDWSMGIMSSVGYGVYSYMPSDQPVPTLKDVLLSGIMYYDEQTNCYRV